MKHIKNYTLIIMVVSLTLIGITACNESSVSGKQVAVVYPQLAGSPIGNAVMVSLPRNVLLRSGDVIVTVQDLEEQFEAIPEEVQEELRNNLLFVLEQSFTEKAMFAQAKEELREKGRNVDEMDEREILQTFFMDLTEDISVDEQEVSDFYNENADLMNGMPFELAQQQIESFLLQQQRQELLEEYVMAVITGQDMEVSATWMEKYAPLALDNDVDRAREAGIPVLVVFDSEESDDAADQMDNALREVGEEYDERLNIVRILVDEQMFLSSRYGVQSVPTLVFFDHEGVEIVRHVGPVSKEEIEEQLNTIIGQL